MAPRERVGDDACTADEDGGTFSSLAESDANKPAGVCGSGSRQANSDSSSCPDDSSGCSRPADRSTPTPAGNGDWAGMVEGMLGLPWRIPDSPPLWPEGPLKGLSSLAESLDALRASDKLPAWLRSSGSRCPAAEVSDSRAESVGKHRSNGGKVACLNAREARSRAESIGDALGMPPRRCCWEPTGVRPSAESDDEAHVSSSCGIGQEL